jgi:hypothetical protein
VADLFEEVGRAYADFIRANFFAAKSLPSRVRSLVPLMPYSSHTTALYRLPMHSLPQNGMIVVTEHMTASDAVVEALVAYWQGFHLYNVAVF